MASAYYSRNKSYSRSFNAERAEVNDRYPLTRAAKHLGISVKAFKNGLDLSGITTNEWHHVGKYANMVDYYDVSNDSEIVNSYKFWKGAMNKSNKDVCTPYYKKALKRQARENIEEKALDWYVYSVNSNNEKKGSFEKKVKELLHEKILNSISSMIGVRNENQRIVGRVGRYCNFVTPFSLHPDNIKKIKDTYRKNHQQKFKEKINYHSSVRFFNKKDVKKVLDRYVRCVVHSNSLVNVGVKEKIIAAKILKKIYPNSILTTDEKFMRLNLIKDNVLINELYIVL